MLAFARFRHAVLAMGADGGSRSLALSLPLCLSRIEEERRVLLKAGVVVHDCGLVALLDSSPEGRYGTAHCLHICCELAAQALCCGNVCVCFCGEVLQRYVSVFVLLHH